MSRTVAAIDVAELVRRYETPTRVADLLCDRHAHDGREALLYDAPSGTRSVSFEQLTNRSRNLAAALAEQGVGVGRGDRVAVLLPAPRNSSRHFWRSGDSAPSTSPSSPRSVPTR